jgi:hypothetical protein
VFFTTTTDNPKEPCGTVTSALFAMTYLGGAAYDSTGEGAITSMDKIVVKEILGRATAPFVADQHLYYGTDNHVEIFGDPEGFNTALGKSAARLLTWREVR